MIARHLRLTPARVRVWLKKFRAGGFDALADQPHHGRPGSLTPDLLTAIRDLLAQNERTWTTRQLAVWLAETHGVVLSRDHLGTLLRRAKLSCRRTERALDHKQDPEAVAAGRAALEALEKGEMPGVWTSAT
jgi:transposase